MKIYGLLLFAGVLLSQVAVAQTGVASGQSRTLLPDGRILLLGGKNSQSMPVSTAWISGVGGSFRQIKSRLTFARVGHTATVLPDGTVFIFGGMGADQKIVAQAELFDPATERISVLPDVLATPRAYHTATLLTDGTVLLAGGVRVGGQFPDDVQLCDFRSRKAFSAHASLSVPRQNHTAALLADGTVRITGGSDYFGNPVATAEIYDPVTKRFRLASSSEIPDSSLSLTLAESIPVDGATEVSLSDPIAMRFTQLLDNRKVTDRSITLFGPDDAVVPAKLTIGEGGRLAFVLPQSPLRSGTSYVLRLLGVLDVEGRELPPASISFQTMGESPASADLDWLPNAAWTDNTGITKFQELSPLQAAPGVTALSGQVLKLNGWPLEHVTLEIDGKKARSDSTGRFLLQGLAPGHHVLWIDGSTANHAGASYGVYEVGPTIQAKKTNVLNYTIWMTRLDTAHAVNIPSPTRTDTVISNPYLPGLELHLPAGSVITDRKGKIVREISITPVPLNKPPFPLPAGVEVPLYFTIQPGGAYIKVLNSKSGETGARLIYPNAGKLAPGAPFEFWNYDADAKGWYVYGLGKVSQDGRSVVPDPGVVIYEFTGAMVGPPGQAAGIGRPVGSNAQAGDPIDLSTGQFIYTKTDLALPDTFPINLTRTYIANDSRARAFGIGTTFNYDIFMVGDTSPYDYQELILPDGGRVRFDRISAGTDYNSALYVHASSGSPFYGALLSVNNDITVPGFWKLVLKDGTTYGFPEADNATSYNCQAVVGIQDRYRNTISITRDSHCRVTKISSPNGRYITLTYGASGVAQATDSSGRTVLYTYDAAGRLSTVTDAGGGVTTYTYDDQNRMLTIQDARNIVYLTNTYDSAGRVKTQTQGDGGVYQFTWTAANAAQTHNFVTSGPTGGTGGSAITRNGCWTSSGFNRYDSNCGEGYMALVAQVDVTDPRGYTRRVQFNSNGYSSSDTYALNQPEQQVFTYQYYADNTLKSVTDPLGRTTSFDYDANGNRTRVTRLDGTPNAVTTTFAYEPQFNHLTSVTDPLNHTSAFNYDSLGNMTSAVDPLSHAISFGYNSAGQVTSATDALNNTVRFGYFGGDLVSVTDPLGNVSTSFVDPAGRVVSAVDAQGNVSKYQYSNLNLLTQETDPRGNVTAFGYDANGNLLSLTDALNHTTQWTYDNMDRPQTRKDPLQRQESYSYDLNGNVVSTTDRKGQTASLSYDPLNRRTLAGFNTVVNGGVTTYESTIGYTYDAGDRLTQAVDSTGGTITEAYDDLDRLTSETTSQGSISYGYDNAGRRTSMTVAGQPQLTYSYDNASRLTQIAQGTSTVNFSYDNANRRSTLTLSNGVNVSYTYDNDSRVTGITYKFNTSTLGDLAYTYDALGRRTLLNGSFAGTGLPGAMASAAYDAANELTNWNGTAISYDLNGNMLSDGTNTFSWNARNQIASLNSASLQYDAFGRRLQNASGKSFLYDGANAAQELSGSTATANLIGGGIDEIFTRADSTGTYTPLQDALGSTVALVDAAGNLATQYAYDPFGNTSVSGATNSNAFQYTGRENEGSGLYYYRTRYYSPVLGRFVNQDPLGFKGGSTNLYTYVLDNPTNFTDPSGKNPLCVIGGLAGVISYNSFVIYQSLAGRKASYYAGWDGLGRIGAGNAAAFGAGCTAGFGVSALGTVSSVAVTSGGTTVGASYVFFSGSGAKEAATEWSAANNGIMIGMTEFGEAIENGTMTAEAASQAFATSASGTAHIFSTAPFVNFGNIWYLYELPALGRNPNVTNIVVHQRF
jgi:RHS repeat-associated protein